MRLDLLVLVLAPLSVHRIGMTGRHRSRLPAARLAAGGREPQFDAAEAEAEAEVDGEDDISVLDRATVKNAAIMGQGKEGRTQVYGAWLDNEIVFNTGEIIDDTFSEGIAAMRKGQYSVAVSKFSSAIEEAGGEGTSRGGQICVWLAQAQHACGDTDAAILLLERLEQSHSNRNVRKAAYEIKYILAAPTLKLDERNFVQIPDKIQQAERRGRGEPKYAKMEKPPERYSLEWYMLQESVDPSSSKRSADPTVGVAAVTALTVVIYVAAATIGWV